MGKLRVGLIGNPVEHSLSPIFQQVAFDALGIDTTYELWQTEDNEVARRIESLRTPDTLGANVTVPHKTRAFELVDRLSDRASQAGAVNTIVNSDGELHGDNTDIPGFLAPLHEREFPFSERSAVVLGAGGAARGVVVALLQAGCRSITVANRTIERAEILRDDLGVSLSVTSLGNDLSDRLPDTHLLVNSTAIGWDSNALPIERDQIEMLPTGAVVYDLTYRETGILRAASEEGYETLDGLAMLVHQGAESFRIWTGQEPPVEKMWEAAVAERDARARA